MSELCPELYLESKNKLKRFRLDVLVALAVRHVMVEAEKSKADISDFSDLVQLVEVNHEYMAMAKNTWDIMRPCELDWYLEGDDWVARNGWQEGVFIARAVPGSDCIELVSNRIGKGAETILSRHDTFDGAKISAQLKRERSFFFSSRIWRVLCYVHGRTVTGRLLLGEDI